MTDFSARDSHVRLEAYHLMHAIPEAARLLRTQGQSGMRMAQALERKANSLGRALAYRREPVDEGGTPGP